MGPLTAGLLAVALGGAAGDAAPAGAGPPLEAFCLEAQQVVGRTGVTPALVVHQDFDAFVKSKASIEPLTIHEYIWYEDEARTRPVMVSCKMKSADHLNEALGPGTSAGDGLCQDMNRLTARRVQASLAGKPEARVEFDPAETVSNPANPGMTGPDWLKPYVLVTAGADGGLVIHSKGFRVDWLDPRFAAMPGRFRGVQYCHFIAPAYLQRLLQGQAMPGLAVGREVTDLSRAPAPDPAPASASPAGR